METLQTQSNIVLELDFYRALAKFSFETWQNPSKAKDNAISLQMALDKLMQNTTKPSDELVGHLGITINALLCPYYDFLHGGQQRSIPLPNTYDYNQLKEAFPILYEILCRVGTQRVHQKINGAYFCVDRKHLYIFLRAPPMSRYKYIPHEFMLPSEQTPRRLSLVNVQHVVHDLGDLFSILNLTKAAQHCKEAEFKGGPHHAYHGPDIVWFGPLLSNNENIDDCQDMCSLLNSKASCYGCYRFYIPFKALLRYNMYILGTRKYDEEYCHTIMFTDTNVESVKLIEDLNPVPLTETKVIEQVDDQSFKWLCYRSKKEEYDQLDFAIAASSLKFDPDNDKIRLEFVDHKKCMRNYYRNRKQDCPDTLRVDAMKQFLAKLNEYEINLGVLKSFFDDTVYKELEELQEKK